MKRATTLIALLLLPLLVIAGCSSGGNSSANANGSLTVAASFPENGQTGKIGTAQLDTGTARIKVEVIPTSGIVFTPYNANNPYYGSYSFSGLQTRNLTASAPSTTFTNLPVGTAYVLITSFDANGKALDQVKAIGEIVEGSNSLTATMLRGSWTFNAPLALNKTLASDQTTISGFGAASPVGMPKTRFASYTSIRSNFQSYSQDLFMAGAEIGALFHGNFSNYTTGCRGPQVYNPATGSSSTVTGWNSSTMCGSNGYYGNYFKGTTNLNSIDGADISLKPDMTYPKGFWPGDKTNRYAFVMGAYSSPVRAYVAGSGKNSTTFSDPSIQTTFQNNYTRVTGGSAISGNVVEAVTKWYSSSRRCYNGTTEVACNQQMYKAVGKSSSGRQYQSALASALWKRMAGISTASANAQGCYIDLMVTSYSEYTMQQYTGYDPTTQQPIYANITNKSTDYEKLDACINQFTASGAQATTADINISDQITELYFGSQY